MPNLLINEKSPYLLQHAHNPVHWHPWGEEAFAKAKAANLPVLVSIGYAACHWCHVMEHESFEDEQVAAYMNEHFVCIKVDREEHPDVDHFYMDALQAISGSGGWPLNMFATPDKAPFYGGTYFPPVPAYGRVSWGQLLQRITDLWQQQSADVQHQAQQMLAHLGNAGRIGTAGTDTQMDAALCNKAAAALLEQADTVDGGFGRAPKFPGTMAIGFLLEHYRYSGNEQARAQALLSLDKMIQGGIYDQIGGGFARYSVDDQWLAPHFEKMLYDNALLVSTLADAYQLTGQPRYRQVITDTIAFANRELKDPASGLYYSALDADSEGIEGKFYTWTMEEWTAALGSAYPLVAAYYGVAETGNWEHTNILHIPIHIEKFIEKHNVTEAALLEQLHFVNDRLLQVREQRVRPLTDDKSLLSWNALFNLALCKAGLALGNEELLQEATAHAAAMMQYFEVPEGLMHTWKQGQARIVANLDDYAYLIQALTQLGTATGDLALVTTATRLMEDCLHLFAADKPGMLYFSAPDKGLPVRKIEVYDGALPSANAVHTHNLILLGFINERPEWQRTAAEIIAQMKGNVQRYPYSFGYWATLAQRSAVGWRMVVCTGAAAHSYARQLQKGFHPHAFLITFQKQISEYSALQMKYLRGDSIIFVCNETECLPPVGRPEEAASLLENRIF